MAQFNFDHSSFSFLNQGAIIQNYTVAGQNIVLGFTSPEPYHNAPYFGETIGRVANRIGDAVINNLNGRSYELTANQASKNHLHGGTTGWGHRQFSGPRSLVRNGRDAVLFTYVSADGEEGYPGTVELRVWYTPYEDQNGKAVLEVEYEVEFTGSECEETVVNVTNHSYFNLGNDPTIEGTEVMLATNEYLQVDEHDIPTGEVNEFPGIQAGRSFHLGAKEPSIDNCFLMNRTEEMTFPDTRSRELNRLASAYAPSTGIHLEVFSTEPSFQFYTGDYVDVAASEHGPARTSRAGFCVEPGRFINAINHPEWRNQVLLHRGKSWGSRIVYKAWKA